LLAGVLIFLFPITITWTRERLLTLVLAGVRKMQCSEGLDNKTSVASHIIGISTHLPESVLTNEQLADAFESWGADKIFEKTGIRQRHIVGEDETALDLGIAAAEKLFSAYNIDRQSIDYLIFCTQSPDYILPSSACIMQHRLHLPKSVGALDITLGCSGFVYGLSLATGLIAGGMANRVLLVTADTYSKFIHEGDRSVRTLFGDGAAATLVARANEAGPTIGAFVFGTDGSGANELIIESGGARLKRSEETGRVSQDESGNIRSRDNLYMNGGAVMSFTLREVPTLYKAVKEKANIDEESLDYVVMHQANRFMLDALRKKMKLASDKVPYVFEDIGNTVSSTIPFVLERMYEEHMISPGKSAILLGFGVGLSWAGCALYF
jgi:3-oxoacyl-[acyl-carrier-protein] synthase III